MSNFIQFILQKIELLVSVIGADKWNIRWRPRILIRSSTSYASLDVGIYYSTMR
jgi:hypothetical protein